jgi:hypothetical protein
MAEETIVYGSAGVEPTTLELKVEAFIVWSACSVNIVSSIFSTRGRARAQGM